MNHILEFKSSFDRDFIFYYFILKNNNKKCAITKKLVAVNKTISWSHRSCGDISVRSPVVIKYAEANNLNDRKNKFRKKLI